MRLVVPLIALFVVALTFLGFAFPLLPGNVENIIEKKEGKSNESAFKMTQKQTYRPIDYEQGDNCDLNDSGSLFHCAIPVRKTEDRGQRTEKTYVCFVLTHAKRKTEDRTKHFSIEEPARLIFDSCPKNKARFWRAKKMGLRPR